MTGDNEPSPNGHTTKTASWEGGYWDYVLVGGGLQNGLIALALLDRNPNSRIAMVERSFTLGGNHTWSFHLSDIDPGSSQWFEPLITYRWPRYEVSFPDRQRVVDLPYASIASSHFHQVVLDRVTKCGGSVLFGKSVTEVTREEVTLDDGSKLQGWVVDARGPKVRATNRGYQKFVGLEVEISPPLEPPVPIFMDASVEQHDGFRFFYVLPFTPTRCIVEDTYFSDGPELDVEVVTQRIKEYADRRGWRIERIVRREEGVLPMPWHGTIPEDASENGPLIGGYAGGWFHPATCYSVAVAARLAQLVAEIDPARPGNGESWSARLAAFRSAHASQVRFAERLNGLLFRSFAPSMRWHIFSRFFGLPDGAIARFFALQMTFWDRCRLLGGRPPKGFSVKRLLRGAHSS